MLPAAGAEGEGGGGWWAIPHDALCGTLRKLDRMVVIEPTIQITHPHKDNTKHHIRSHLFGRVLCPSMGGLELALISSAT
jgi:hypothetical protein